jgi:hypothetical protein
LGGSRNAAVKAQTSTGKGASRPDPRRRIEALARVIDNPVRALTRLAPYIAKLPREALEPLRDLNAFRRCHWLHGRGDYLAAAARVRRGAAVLCALDSS